MPLADSRELLVNPILLITTVFALASVTAAVTGVASPPVIRGATGVIFCIAAFYFWQICPMREDRPGWIVPFFVVMGVVFLISGIKLHASGIYAAIFERVASIGFIFVSLFSWFVFAVYQFNDIPDAVKPIVEEINGYLDHSNQDNNTRE